MVRLQSFFTGAIPRAGESGLAPADPGFQDRGKSILQGTADLAVYLINTPQGKILVNSDFEQDVPLIRKTIEGLGFKYRDTRIILISRAHGDHDAAAGIIKRETSG